MPIMTNTSKDLNEDAREYRENERVTKDDVIVQTPNGERYKAHLINATGLPTELVEEIDRTGTYPSDQ